MRIDQHLNEFLDIKKRKEIDFVHITSLDGSIPEEYGVKRRSNIDEMNYSCERIRFANRSNFKYHRRALISDNRTSVIEEQVDENNVVKGFKTLIRLTGQFQLIMQPDEGTPYLMRREFISDGKFKMEFFKPTSQNPVSSETVTMKGATAKNLRPPILM